MRTSPSNGGTPRHVEESEQFIQQRHALEPLVPRLREILRGQRRHLASHAEVGGFQVTDEAWVRETVMGHGAPRLLILYKVTPTRVLLDQVHLAEQDADDALPF